ncbi:YciI family protein [Streptomyces abikoensis]|uniref:YciI family protein n=1 Tax=Streptomyces abikoensis TaxID=97398 RepID=A0ABW7TC60_9ACTN
MGGEALETGHVTPAAVRRRADGTSAVADGPVRADEETLGGWFIVDVADREEAVELAKSLPTPETIEIRPILESV